MPIGTPEGLCYMVTRRLDLPAGATDEQILNEFLDFTLNGVTDANGDYVDAQDGTGAMNGTINWLAGYGIYKANFFVTRKPALMFFVSIPNGSDPWSKNPGFTKFIKKGELTIDLGTGEILLEARTELDKALAKMKPTIASVSAAERPNLLDALKGEKRKDLNKVIKKLDREQSIGLRDLFEKRKAEFKNLIAAASKT